MAFFVKPYWQLTIKTVSHAKKEVCVKLHWIHYGTLPSNPVSTQGISYAKKKNVLGQFKYDKNINNCNNNKIDRLIKDELSFNLSSIIAYF